ncbi:MAG: EF-hand domain-containing protein [Alcanivorax sp.]
MRLFSLLLVFGLLGTSIQNGYARQNITETEQKSATQALDTLDKIPAILRSPLMRQTTRENYISQTMRFLRAHGTNKSELTAEGLKHKQENAKIQARKRQIQNILNYDTNLDAQVSIEEARASILQSHPRYSEDRYSRQLETMVERVKKLDTDEDGIVTYTEMGILNESAEKNAVDRLTSQYKQYLELDPNKDGTLTGNELENLARQAFDVIDTDKNGLISNEELAPFTQAQRTYGRQINTAAQCKLPAAPEDQKIVSIGVYEGKALSNVTAMGQDRETTAIKIHIKDDQPPTYLLLSSYDPIMWDFTGNTDAIKRVVVGNSIVNTNQKSGSGVIGIAKDKITFAPHKCLPYYNNNKSAKFTMAKGAIRKLLKRFPDVISGTYSTGKIVLSHNQAAFESPKNENEKTITIVTGGGDDLIIGADGERIDSLESWRKKQMGKNYRPPVPAPEGYDKQLWSHFLRYSPEGIYKVDADKVVSDQKAEPYEILPQMAGIIQLIHEGKVEKIDMRQFRIIKDIPRFPAGLAGGHSVTFLIAPGVKKPDGGAGHSCVIMEETGEAVSMNALCR